MVKQSHVRIGSLVVSALFLIFAAFFLLNIKKSEDFIGTYLVLIVLPSALILFSVFYYRGYKNLIAFIILVIGGFVMLGLMADVEDKDKFILIAAYAVFIVANSVVLYYRMNEVGAKFDSSIGTTEQYFNSKNPEDWQKGLSILIANGEKPYITVVFRDMVKKKRTTRKTVAYSSNYSADSYGGIHTTGDATPIRDFVTEEYMEEDEIVEEYTNTQAAFNRASAVSMASSGRKSKIMLKFRDKLYDKVLASFDYGVQN